MSGCSDHPAVLKSQADIAEDLLYTIGVPIGSSLSGVLTATWLYSFYISKVELSLV